MSKKKRRPISPKASAAALFAAARTCCVCQVAGRTIQIHHIDDDPANNEPGNFAVLCLECHNETQVRGGFGRGLTAPVVRQYRDDWLARVRKRRADADALAVQAMTAAGLRFPEASPSSAAWRPDPDSIQLPSQAGLAEFVRILPDLRRRAYLLMYAKRPITPLDTAQGYLEVTAVLEHALATLLAYYPDNHFSEGEPAYFVSAMLAERTHWHYLRTSSQGVGRSGSLAQVWAAIGIVQDLERLITETVSSLTGTEVRDPDEAEEAWLRAWQEPIETNAV